MKTKIILVLLVLLLMTAPGCQGSSEVARSSSPGQTSPKSSGPSNARRFVTNSPAAEQEAQNHPKAPPPKIISTIFKKDVPGTAKRKCVNVNSVVEAHPKAMRQLGGAIRSGEFVAGNFALALSPPLDVNPLKVKIWWAPLHTQRMPGLKVEATPLKGSGKVRIKHAVASNQMGSFYPSGLRFSKPGTWRLIVTSGPDWGCFDLTLSDS